MPTRANPDLQTLRFVLIIVYLVWSDNLFFRNSAAAFSGKRACEKSSLKARECE